MHWFSVPHGGQARRLYGTIPPRFTGELPRKDSLRIAADVAKKKRVPVMPFAGDMPAAALLFLAGIRETAIIRRVVISPIDFNYWERTIMADASTAAIPPSWLEEFEAAARRPLPLRFRYAFIHTYKPVLDDAPFRAFDTMEDYRRWCEENLPEWLGYGRA
jgi:hypothetical protein